MKKLRHITWVMISVTLLLVLLPGAKSSDKARRGDAEEMLRTIAADVREYYYDPKFHGVNWDAAVANVEQKIETSNSMSADMFYIAALLDELNDSHLYFVMPPHANSTEYGWQDQMIGDRCYVSRVRPGTDAEAKGLKPGQQIVAINGHVPTREDFWKMEYVYRVLRPQAKIDLIIQGLDRVQRHLTIDTKTHPVALMNGGLGAHPINFLEDEWREEARERARFVDFGPDLTILKLADFDFSDGWVDSMKKHAKKHKALILDLRNNRGGSEQTLQYFLSSMFDRKINICDRVGRKKTATLTTSVQGRPFDGKLAVLVDGSSMSAAEIFARVIQIEKRGIVIGDRTSGRVMQSRLHFYDNIGLPYGASITEADVIMTDHRSLENVGVIPDEKLLPAMDDLMAGRDPVLAYAAARSLE